MNHEFYENGFWKLSASIFLAKTGLFIGGKGLGHIFLGKSNLQPKNRCRFCWLLVVLIEVPLNFMKKYFDIKAKPTAKFMNDHLKIFLQNFSYQR